MSGRTCPDKGKRGEFEPTRFLTDRGFAAHRGQQFQGGPDSPYVVCKDLPGIHWDVKRTERLNLFEALGQAQLDAAGKLPAAKPRDLLANAPRGALLAVRSLSRRMPRRSSG